jgi:uncharacterized protein (DUF433 family)
MALAIALEPTPIETDPYGIVRVAKTRVTLDTVVTAFLEGCTPEEISEQYPSLRLPDVYLVIGYYLRHRDEIHTYLAERQRQAEAIQEEAERRFNPIGIRDRLLARRNQPRWSEMVRFLADENFNNQIVRGVLRQSPDVDIVRVQDVDLSGADDPTVLAWGAQEGRIVLTHDVATMTTFAYERIQAGLPMPGLFEVSRRVPVGLAIEEIILIAECSLEGEWEGQVRFLPLR